MTPAVFILSYSNLIRYDCSHIVHVCTLYFAHILIIVWGLLNLDIITSTPPLECLYCYLCVICNSNRFHSFIIKVCIMIVHILVMCTGDAGPEQSLVLLAYVLGVQKNCLIETVHLSTHKINFLLRTPN